MMAQQHKEIILEVVRKMENYGLGLRRKTVELSEYNALWVTAFLWIKDKLENQLGSAQTYEIEHFGSTSMLIPAKPTLDIMVIFENELGLKASISKFASLGFIYKGDAVGNLHQIEPDPGRHFFAFYDLEEQIDYIHLHVFAEGHPDVGYNLKFRDTLRNDPDLATKYVQLKRGLHDQGLSRHEYTKSKASFISQIIL